MVLSRRIVGVILLLGLIWFVSGYRLGALRSAAGHFAVSKPATLVDTVDTGWGAVYIFRTAKGPRTVGCVRWSFLWRCPVAITADPSDPHPVETVGGLSWRPGDGKQVTVFAVQTNGPEVAFIEAGPPDDRVRQPVAEGHPVVFQWSQAMFYHDFNPQALSRDGVVLYEYRVARKPAISLPGDLGWFPPDAALDKQP